MASPNNILNVLFSSTFETTTSTRLSFAFGVGFFSLFMYSGLSGSWDLVMNHKELASPEKGLFVAYTTSLSVIFIPAYLLSILGFFKPAPFQKRSILSWYLFIFIWQSFPSVGIMVFLAMCLWGV